MKNCPRKTTLLNNSFTHSYVTAKPSTPAIEITHAERKLPLVTNKGNITSPEKAYLALAKNPAQHPPEFIRLLYHPLPGTSSTHGKYR